MTRGWEAAVLGLCCLWAAGSGTWAAQEPGAKPPEIGRETLAAIQDDSPLPTAESRSPERQALSRFVRHAREVPGEDLAGLIQPGVTGRQLYENERSKFRGLAVRITGQLQRLRPVPLDADLEAAGAKQLFEAWILDPFSFEKPVCALVTEIPGSIKPADPVVETVWVTCDGFFFKRFRAGGKDGPELVPLLVARSLRRNDTTEAPARDDARLNCPVDWLERIEDDQPVQNLKSNPDEYNAYNFFVMRARQVSPALMAENANRKMTFGRMYEAGRGKYRGEIIHVEGRLKRVVWIGSNSDLEAQGVKDLYEAWIFPEEYFGNPTCVIISELPPGLEPGEDIPGKWGSFDGYFFKRYKYRAVDATRLAPLAIGRTLKVKDPPTSEEGASTFESYSRFFVPVLVALALGLVGLVVMLSRWFRQGDREVQQRLADTRGTEFVPPSSGSDETTPN